ncbi:multidrug resistance efflux transporter family protein [Brevibacillus laterosporus]|uniref:multidrug resistance efflux transporter family protein n=1 Tax=Brevibacillus laterosporus TaxID=1465 RepID=UPI003452ADA5
MRPIWIGILASFFFAFTFVLNRSMELAGGSWMWSAALRFFSCYRSLLFLVFLRGNLGMLWIEIKKRQKEWIVWSTVGFGLFYAPFCFVQAYGPGWLIAGTWQITIISGSLAGPVLFRAKNRLSGRTISARENLDSGVMDVKHHFAWNCFHAERTSECTTGLKRCC